MATAEELLARLANPSTEPHIVIGADRSITVPLELRRIAVQHDHNIETVTFDCPRYWDGVDMATMRIYVNYRTPDNRYGSYPATNVVVDSANTNVMHFDWTISREVTFAKGTLAFLVCTRKIDADGNEVNHWNSELSENMHISEGLECDEQILSPHPDVLTEILARLDALDALGGINKAQISLPKLTNWHAVKNGNVVTLNYTLEGGKTHTDVITLDDYGYPVSIVSDGFEATGTWEGFE